MRRVVTGHDNNGKSVFISDGETSRKVILSAFPDITFLDEIWSTDEIVDIPVDDSDPTIKMESFVPPPGGSRFTLITFAPEKEYIKLLEEGNLNLDEMDKENREKMPGLAETMEADNPGMHTTDTVDYGIILSGEVYLELDDGAEVLLRQGDVYVQNGTRHAWHNKGDAPCIAAVIMIGAKRKDYRKRGSQAFGQVRGLFE